jgi:hypothetical protein
MMMGASAAVGRRCLAGVVEVGAAGVDAAPCEVAAALPDLDGVGWCRTSTRAGRERSVFASR